MRGLDITKNGELKSL